MAQDSPIMIKGHLLSISKHFESTLEKIRFPAENSFRGGFPKELDDAEKELLGLRRRSGALNSADPVVGFGLSGGGIRSATFSLGVFQTLAGIGLLPRIDYLSGVSGGGYFASFYGRLFSRDDVKGFEDINRVLALDTPSGPDGADGGISEGDSGVPVWQGKVFRWLRENGRYLSPKGAGDLLLDLAGVFRNWVAIQLVLLIFFATIFLVIQLIRALWPGVDEISCWFLPSSRAPWSPWIWLPVLVAILFVIPAGWAYWLVERKGQASPREVPPWCAVAFALGLAACGIVFWLGAVITAISLIVFAVGVITLGYWRIALATARRRYRRRSRAREASDQSSDRAQAERDEVIFVAASARTLLTRILSVTLVATTVLIVFISLDSLGEHFYVSLAKKHSPILPGIAALVAAVAPAAKWIVINLTPTSTRTRPSISLNAVALIAAALITGLYLVLVDAATHAIAWRGSLPVASCLHCSFQLVRDRQLLFNSFAIALLFSFLFGRTRTFLNRSSHQGIYSARLTRAYLGASNADRHSSHQRATDSISDVLPGDDIDQKRYWPDQGDDPYKKGAPLHLVNVTINETVSGKSEIEQRDRKGLAMALGPAGISAGVTNHLIFRGHNESQGKLSYDRVHVLPSQGSAFERSVVNGKIRAELLPLGQWTGISGAAFSPGLGSRTSLGISVLAGFFNVRLGYWWNAGQESLAAIVSRSLGRRLGQFLRQMITFLFPVQMLLLSEFASRFYGTAKEQWYLSDGGHFENLAGYELIRRRLPVIVLIDAEEDSEYTFDGLANLIRKARLDFAAEIRFLSQSELTDSIADPDLRRCFGTLEQLRRGTWVQEPVEDPNVGGQRRSIEPAACEKLSLAHAALGRVYYQDNETPPSTLIYIKPTLTGDEPTDVHRYHFAHPDFPHESTVDQFFDEAQWESYRRLGVHIASKVFAGPSDPAATSFKPRHLHPLH